MTNITPPKKAWTLGQTKQKPSTSKTRKADKKAEVSGTQPVETELYKQAKALLSILEVEYQKTKQKHLYDAVTHMDEVLLRIEMC